MKLPILTLSAVIFVAGGACAQRVAEWNFDGDKMRISGETVPITVTEIEASAESQLMVESTCSPESTGISDKWAEHLRTGFLDVGAGSGTSSIGQNGLVTKNPKNEDGKLFPADSASYKAYFGIRGTGGGSEGGTVYFVVSPKNWQGGSHDVFGTGHIGGRLQLTVQDGNLTFTAGPTSGERASTSLSREWLQNDWYFIGISWSGGSEPVLYVRQMNAAGAKFSDPGETGTATGPVPSLEDQPDYDPIAIGSVWINTGGPDSRHTLGGANARFAYVRMDRQYSTPPMMEEVFQSLSTE